MRHALCDAEDALALLDRAVALARASGSHWIVVEARIERAAVLTELGRLDAAEAEEDPELVSRTCAERSGAGIIEGAALTVLATAELHRGDTAAAVSRAEAAVAVHRRTDHHLGKARALKALGLALRACPDDALTGERAESCLREAYELFDSFGSYEAETVS